MGNSATVHCPATQALCERPHHTKNLGFYWGLPVCSQGSLGHWQQKGHCSLTPGKVSCTVIGYLNDSAFMSSKNLS